jgi:hypothetical protein
MAFDYKKFLVENQLTSTSRIKNKFLKEEEGDKLSQLITKKDDILAKYKSGELSLDQYRTAIGNIPQQIKNLRADAEAAQNKELGVDGEEDDNIEKTGDKDSDVSGVEAKLLQKSAGGSQFTDNPVSDDEEEAPSRFDADYYDNDENIDEASTRVTQGKKTDFSGVSSWGKADQTELNKQRAELDVLDKRIKQLHNKWLSGEYTKEKYLKLAKVLNSRRAEITSSGIGNPDLAASRYNLGNPDYVDPSTGIQFKRGQASVKNNTNNSDAKDSYKSLVAKKDQILGKFKSDLQSLESKIEKLRSQSGDVAKKQLDILASKKDDLLANYKSEIGNIPQELKKLKSILEPSKDGDYSKDKSLTKGEPESEDNIGYDANVSNPEKDIIDLSFTKKKKK